MLVGLLIELTVINAFDMFLPFSGFRKKGLIWFTYVSASVAKVDSFGGNSKCKEKESRDNFSLFPCDAYQCWWLEHFSHRSSQLKYSLLKVSVSCFTFLIWFFQV